MDMSSWWPEITLSPPAPSRFKILHNYKRQRHQWRKCCNIRAERGLFCFSAIHSGLWALVLAHKVSFNFQRCIVANAYCQINIRQVQPSDIFQAMLSGPGQFAENETNEVHTICPLPIGILYNFQVNFREIPSHVLQKVCMYFTYKTRYYCQLVK